MFTPVAGRSVVVTGGTRGIGRGIARVFALAGANVLVTGRDEAVASAAAAELTLEAERAGSGGRVDHVCADVATAEGNAAVAAAAIAANGGIDVLCANAGVFPEAALSAMDADGLRATYDTVFGTNVLGMMFSVQACLPSLVASGHGRIVVTSSITGPITGYPGWTHYGASKAAQLGWMRTAAIELATTGVTVNAVLPGNIRTEGLLDMGEEYVKAMEASIPMGRLGLVEDIGHAALFLASDEAGFITGQTIVVDGGQVLPESADAVSVG
jgi:3-oxoacyl-[acyl-carrier protein] reductase